jgi:UDP-N-acetylmuramoylalanine--D-glutamate ligase
VTDWSHRRVVVIGLGRQGKALTRYLAQRGARVVVSDIRSASALETAREELAGVRVEYSFGGHPPELLDGADLVCLSGGVPADLPLAQQALKRGIPLSNDSQVFLEACAAPTIGITGSAGKTTTTALVGRMAQLHAHASGRHAWVGGNIGRSMLEDLDSIRPDDLVVMELSSFQLELMTRSPHIAAVLNITPNHLDRHKTMKAYASAKQRILDYQSAQDLAVLGRDDPGAWCLADRVKGRRLAFGRDLPAAEDGAAIEAGQVVVHNGGEAETICRTDEIRLRGAHNQLNAAAACAIALGAGIPAGVMRSAILDFQGEPHRLQLVRTFEGVDWYDDSIATTPERAIAAILSFDEPIVLLAGGRDKDLDWDEFARLVSVRVDHLILFGEAAGKIHKAMQASSEATRQYTLDISPDLRAAFEAAARRAAPGDVVLLSPGGTSFDEFVDFAARGDRYAELVRAL